MLVIELIFMIIWCRKLDLFYKRERDISVYVSNILLYHLTTKKR